MVPFTYLITLTKTVVSNQALMFCGIIVNKYSDFIRISSYWTIANNMLKINIRV